MFPVHFFILVKGVIFLICFPALLSVFCNIIMALVIKFYYCFPLLHFLILCFLLTNCWEKERKRGEWKDGLYIEILSLTYELLRCLSAIELKISLRGGLTFIYFLCRETETTKDEIGVEGILSRLQKQRNQTFGLGLGDKEDSTFLQSNDVKEDWHPKLSKDLVS